MLIGIAGGICSGKDTVGEYLRTKFGFSVANSSEELRREMVESGFRVSRMSQREFANERRLRFGSGYLVRRAYERAVAGAHSSRFAIVSFYTVGEAKYFLEELKGHLIGVVGPEPKASYERLVGRSDGARDQLSLDQFLERNAAENAGIGDDDTNVSRVLSLCEKRIPNTGTLDQLYGEIEHVVGGLLADA